MTEITKCNGETSQTGNVDKDILTFFGQNSRVVEGSSAERTINVEVGLRDGICHGGQKAVIELDKSPELIEKSEHGFRRTYRVRKLSINGFTIHDTYEVDFYLQTEDHNDDNEKSNDRDVEEKEIDPITRHFEESSYTRAITPKAMIILSKLQSGDDLAAIFHELGHTRDPETLSPLHEIFEANLHSYLNETAAITAEKAKESLEYLLKMEVFASKMAIKLLKISAKKGVNLFPEDENFYRVKQFLILAILTRVKDSPKLRSLIDNETSNKMVKL